MCAKSVAGGKPGDVDPNAANKDPEEGDQQDADPAKEACPTDPVDAITGAVFCSLSDFEYPGPIPLRWERKWSSSKIDSLGPFGYGSNFAYSMRIISEQDELVFVNEEGRNISFEAVMPGDKLLNRLRKLILSFDGEKYEVFNIISRQRYVFEAKADTNVFVLKQIENETRNSHIDLEYDNRSHLCGMTDSVGRFFQIDTNKTGQITSVRYNGKILAKYVYDDNLNLISITDVNGNSSSLFYDKHLMTKRVTLGGSVFQWEYVGEGSEARCIHSWGENGLLEGWFEYYEGYTIYTDSLGNKKEFHYDDRNNLTKIITDNGITEYAYNKYNEKVSATNADKETTIFEYSELGQITSIIYPNGGISKAEYDKQGRVIKSLTPLSAETVYEYDNVGRIQCVIAPNGNKSLYQYDARGILAAIVEGEKENERVTKFEYDKHLNLSKLTYSNGAVQQWEYDDEGNCIRNINPLGAEQTMAYDAANRLIEHAAPDGNITHLKYNTYEDVIWIKDNEKEISFTYTPLGNLETRTEQNRCVRISYDTEERLTQVENEIGEKYLFERDAAGNVVKETGYDEVIKAYDYSPAGKLNGIKRGESANWTRMEYDNGGYLSKIKYDNGETEEFAYGKIGELLSAENKNTKLTFEYDVIGRLTKETQNGHSVKSRYSEEFTTAHRTGIQTSLGLDVDLTLNKYGQTEGVKASFGSQAEYHSQHTYNELGQMLGRSINTANGNIIKDFWSYDPQGRPLSQTVSINQRESNHRKYTWGLGDKLKSVFDSIAKIGSAYSYDSFNNLETETYEGKGISTVSKRIIRRLDDCGRIIDTLDIANTGSRKYGKGGQLLALEDQRYQYNDCGDLIEKKDKDGGIWSYSYHPGGLLESVVRPDGKAVIFSYDAIGRRVSKEFDGKTTKFIWDGNRIVHEWVEDSQRVNDSRPQPVSWLFEEGTFTPIAKLTKENAYSVISDHLGTPNTMLDENGKAVWEKTIDIFGTEHPRDKERNYDSLHNDNETNCPFRFPGQYDDVETGLYYNRFRYYDPDMGVYTQRDPIGVVGMNPTIYGYVDNTLLKLDPWGLTAELYNLVAKVAGTFPVLNYGQKPTTTTLGKGDLWKIGETTQFNKDGKQTRYSQKWLDDNNLEYKTVASSPNSDDKKKFQQMETQQIDEYKEKHKGELPPGNRCRH